MAVESFGAFVYTSLTGLLYVTEVMADTPVGYWRHESGALGVDSSGNANNATTTTNVVSTAGYIESAGTYNGTTSKQLIPNASSIDSLGRVDINTGKQFTMEFFVYVTALPGSLSAVISKNKGTDGTQGGWSLMLNSVGNMYFRAENTSSGLQTHENTVLTTNTWHHIICVGQGGNNGNAVYYWVDGVFADKNSGITVDSVGGTGIYVDTGNDLKLGVSTDNAGALLNFFPGILDEVSLYNVRLTSWRALQHILAAGFPGPHAYVTSVINSSPKAFYRLQGDTTNGVMLDDWTPQVNTAALSGSVAYGTGQIGSAGTFGGGANSLNAPNTSSVQDLASDGNIFTLEVLLRTTSLATAQLLGSKGVPASSEGWYINITTAGEINCVVNYPTTVGQFKSAASTIAINTWYHVVVICQGNATSSTGIRKIYVNNVSKTITHVSNPTGVYTSDSAKRLVVGGRRNVGDTAYELGFVGKMEEWALYNRELTSTEVASHFALTGL